MNAGVGKHFVECGRELSVTVAAAGVDAATITVTVKGLDYSFDLAHVDTAEHEIQDA